MVIMEKRCTLDSFVTGFIAGLASSHVRMISTEGLEWKTAYTFNEWVKNGHSENLRFTFHLPDYEIDDPSNQYVSNRDLRQAFIAAASRGLFAVNENTLHFTIENEREAGLYLDNVPGSHESWIVLAELFLKTFSNHIYL